MSQEQIQAINAGGPVVQVLIPGFQGPRGLNAYEHALSLGFTGTLADWLLSLTGPAGPTGPKGEDGANFLLFAVNGLNQPIFPPSAVGGQAGYAAAINKFYVCTASGTPGTWQESSAIAGSVFNVYNPLVNAAGPLADRGTYNNEPVGFPYLATDTQMVYVRQGAPGGWSAGIPFRGPAGSTVRSSVGPPSFVDGVDGDYNIDYLNWDIYGPKTGGSWGAARSLDYPAEVAQAAAEAAQTDADAAQAAAAAAQDTADAALPRSGGTMTGNLVVPSLNGGPLAGLRNLIINGSMIASQRGGSFNIAANTGAYTLDRWLCISLGGGSSVQQVIVDRAARLRFSGGAGNTSAGAYQRIESLDIAHLAGQQITISFDVSNTVRTNLVVGLAYPNVADNFSTFTLGPTANVTVNSTLTRYSVTFSLSAQAINGLQVSFTFANQTSGSFDLTRVQLEAGALATPFETIPLPVETLLCKRYFHHVPLNIFGIASGIGQVVEVGIPFPVSMRVVPTVGPLQNIPGLATSFGNAAQGINRITSEWAAPYVQAGTTGTFYAVGFQYPLDAEL